MRSRWLRLLALLTCVLVTAAVAGPVQAQNKVEAARGQPIRHFSFGAAGDHGANPHTAAALRRLDRSDAAFYLALGDLDYDQTRTDRAWCRYVHEHLPRKGARFPFEVLVGNHEQDGGPDGRIRHHARCLPDRLSSTPGPGSGYGAEYAFSYPPRHPLARVIMIAPNLTVNGERHTYRAGSPHRRWLLRQINQARADGVRWVVVGMHYPCLSAGATHGCDAGPEILNLLVRKRVDLVLTGHNHVYERGKQLRRGAGCRWIRPGRFDRDCVVPGWRDGSYRKGAGTVFVTAGSFGRHEQGIDPHDPDRRYFARVDGDALGFVRYVVRPGRIDARLLATADSGHDSFSIG
ncbi:MAG TPA: metallophosphoesterase [Nocardioidaceae bacterium]|nr:metallophosphoesterase [Nocardioidaceae bacterium]